VSSHRSRKEREKDGGTPVFRSTFSHSHQGLCQLEVVPFVAEFDARFPTRELPVDGDVLTFKLIHWSGMPIDFILLAPELERFSNSRTLNKIEKGGFFLRKKPLGSRAFGV
jgi:hypothetical protein